MLSTYHLHEGEARVCVFFVYKFSHGVAAFTNTEAVTVFCGVIAHDVLAKEVCLEAA